jgi:hypothetical protein
VQRRYATLVALAIEGMATVTDEIIDLHDRIIGKLFNAAKNKHQQQFQASGKAINDKVRMYGRIGQALLEAKQSGGDPFAAIEAVMPWDTFAASVTEAQKLAQPESFDFLHRIGDQNSYPSPPKLLPNHRWSSSAPFAICSPSFSVSFASCRQRLRRRPPLLPRPRSGRGSAHGRAGRSRPAARCGKSRNGLGTRLPRITTPCGHGFGDAGNDLVGQLACTRLIMVASLRASMNSTSPCLRFFCLARNHRQAGSGC